MVTIFIIIVIPLYALSSLLIRDIIHFMIHLELSGELKNGFKGATVGRKAMILFSYFLTITLIVTLSAIAFSSIRRIIELF